MVSPFIQKVIIVIVTFLILGYLGYGLMNSASETPIEPDLSSAGTASQDILNLVDKMSKTSIDPSIFSSPLFTNLVDINVPVSPESQGRPNPFAAIGSDQVISQATVVNPKTKTTP
jgi:hypothetical protein